jgi:hypothetical protein
VVIAGMPGVSPQAGAAQVYYSDSGIFFSSDRDRLAPSDGSPGDLFGYSVATSGQTAVVGAPLNDNAKGTDAGAVYVFVRDEVGNWTQQQKLTASDGIDQELWPERRHRRKHNRRRFSLLWFAKLYRHEGQWPRVCLYA